MSELRGDAVVLRPLGPGDAEPLRALREAPEVRAWWGSIEPGFPLTDEPTATRFTIVVDGEVAGMIRFTEEQEPDYRSAEIDLFLDAACTAGVSEPMRCGRWPTTSSPSAATIAS